MPRATPIAFLLFALTAFADDPPVPWFGVSMTVEGTVPEAGDKKFARAIRVHESVPSSPADKAGIRAGDLIVSVTGIDFDKDAEGLLTRFREGIAAGKIGDVLEVQAVRDRVDRSAAFAGKPLDDPSAWKDPDALVMKSPPGPSLELKATRKVELLTFRVTLEAKPGFVGQKAMPPNAQILPDGVTSPPEEAFAAALRAELGLEADYQDQLGRLAKLHEQADPTRLRRFAYAHRDPFKLLPLSQRAVAELVDPARPVGLRSAAQWLDRPSQGGIGHLSPAGLALEARVDEIVALLGRAKAHWDKAFAATSAEEREFALAQLPVLSDAFVDTVVIQSDEKRERIEPNLRLVNIAGRVDLAELFAAALEVQELLDAAQDRLQPDLERAWEEKGKPSDVFFTRDTPLGKILIGGKGHTWYREDAAVIVDLGGDDLYTNGAGTSAGDKLPFSIVIDCAGNDAYEATFDCAQGCGRLGVGALLDLSGNDSYIARRWAQGTCAIGVGMLIDLAGDDTYRGGDYVQAAAMWGVGWLTDGAGNDAYESTGWSQSCAMPGGLSVLRDDRGDDHYYCKGMHPTGYGDAGIFDSWGQACGIGFRGLLSGGLALLVDSEGNDVYEAGNFSQGGGYYFGWGILSDRNGDDRYVGSRYDQGFAAHEAMGYFEDLHGNDVYDTRQGVAQGLSWDETVVAFIDREGDDVYRGGAFFSQGAVAHNGFCLFEDGGGKDTYVYAPGQAVADSNDYHGGTSFGLFLDLGGAEDVYDSDTRNDEVRAKGKHGVVCDLPGALDLEAAKRILRK